MTSVFDGGAADRLRDGFRALLCENATGSEASKTAAIVIIAANRLYFWKLIFIIQFGYAE